MRNEDFIFIDGQAVRLTSVARDGDQLSLVVIVRGSGGHDEMQRLLARESFEVRLGDEPSRRMEVATADLRNTGTGATAIHRFAITLVPAAIHPASPVADHDEDRYQELARHLARIERKLDAIIARLDAGERLPF